MRPVAVFVLALSIACSALASQVPVQTVTLGGGAATTQSVAAQPPQSVVVVNPVPTTQSAVETTVVEPVVQPTITNVPSTVAVNPAISTTTTQLTVVDLPTPTQNIQCRANAECPANTFCNIDGTCRQILLNVQAGSGGQTASSATAAHVSVGAAAIVFIPSLFLL